MQSDNTSAIEYTCPGVPSGDKLVATYPNGIKVVLNAEGWPKPNDPKAMWRGSCGVRFEGTEGWIFVTRGSAATSSDPVSQKGGKSLDASNPKILDSKIGENEIHLYESPEQHLNWLQCIKTRQQPVAPIEVGHRSCSTCLLHHAAMKLKRKLYWDPLKERFKNDDEANALLSRPQRYPYVV